MNFKLLSSLPTEAKLLSAEELIVAYAHGLFPMPDPSDERIIDWYRPQPRAILPLGNIHVSRSMRHELKRTDLTISVNTVFRQVMEECACRPETWITADFIRAYCELHRLGFAHSLEIFSSQKLVGGVYGVSLGGAFFAESMFHRENNMSKLALIKLSEHLTKQGFTLLECQFLTSHLKSLGAFELSDAEYMLRLAEALQTNVHFIH